MNNREWLYSLDVADLSDWFDAEHIETEERALDGDTDALEAKIAYPMHHGYKGVKADMVIFDELHDEHDSREKLEADAFAYLQTAYITYPQIIELLDRQAAITEREHPGLTVSDDESLINWRGRNYLPQSRVLNAERERDEFSLKLKHEIELNLNNRNAHDLERIAELTAERDEWKSRCEKGKAQFDAILAERELYREALSQLLDTVTDGMSKVSAILDNYDEGMA